MKTPLWACALSLAGFACAPANTPAPAVPANVPPAVQSSAPAAPVTQMSLADAGLDASALDRGADPCQDFYQLACGGWIAHTEIPADESSWDRSFSQLSLRNEEKLRDILQGAATTSDDRDIMMGKLGDWWTSCMDEAAIEAAGRKPIEGLLAKARKVRDTRALLALLAELHQDRIWALFSITAVQDAKNATRMIANLDQDGLGLADRDQYLDTDDASKTLRKEYEAHVARMLVLTGMSATQAAKAAGEVVALETSIARISKTQVQRRDPKGEYNKIDRAGLAKAAPAIAWDEYFKRIGFGGIQDVNVTSVPFVEGLNALLGSTKPAQWRSYLLWHIAHSTAHLLSKAFVDEDFKLEQLLSGQQENKARWRRCVASADAGLGELLGQPFVRLFFRGASKESTERMVHTISRAFAADLEGIDWMEASTRAKAQEKLGQVAYQIGYPDKWKSYDFPVDPRQYAANALASRVFETRRDLAKVGQPTDRAEWFMTPPTVNAYYDAQRNQMSFPAGILQTPFYDVKNAEAVNFGAIGMVVGHELTHGFDDEGSQFDGVGNLENWWDPATAGRFAARGECMVAQYGGYEALPGLKLNGKLTLGENIADTAGIKLAFQAYRATRGAARNTIAAEGFTEDQLFFLAHGQAWCTKMQDALARTLVTVDPHSPPRFRVNGPLSNLPEFAAAFRCAQGSPMSPAKRCAVW